MIRPRRSMLYMPGSNARALEKARTLPADGVILDLEDSVAPDAKAVAREQVAAAVAAKGFGRREVLVRINALDTPWWADDLTAAAQAKPDGILVPKISSVAELRTVAVRLAHINADVAIRLWIMIETPLGVLRVEELAAQAQNKDMRLAGLVIGPNDIARETRMRRVPGRAPMIPALMQCVFAAHAYGIDILDGVFNNFSDTQGFAAECAQGRDMGFDGKTLIHPTQVEPCNAAFSPPDDEVAQARVILAAFEKPENQGRGAIQINGQMVERLHAEMARRTVAIADSIAAATAG
jgi:citrate lyase subunit beta / citryl-CoA lyase